MKLKLDLLFKLEKENVILGEFNMIKDELSQKQNLLSKIQSIFDKNYNIEDITEDDQIISVNEKKLLKTYPFE